MKNAWWFCLVLKERVLQRFAPASASGCFEASFLGARQQGRRIKSSPCLVLKEQDPSTMFFENWITTAEKKAN